MQYLPALLAAPSDKVVDSVLTMMVVFVKRYNSNSKTTLGTKPMLSRLSLMLEYWGGGQVVKTYNPPSPPF